MEGHFYKTNSMVFMESLILLMIIILVASVPSSSSTITTRRFSFDVEWAKVTRLCKTKSLLTVNGQFPGPTIVINEGDNVEIKVTNRIEKNTTLHWHGIRQLRTGWADGPAYVTQCPIRGGQSYTYKFRVVDQRGTLWWHAHYSWQRASVYGAFIIYPRMPYPFSTKIQDDFPIIFGEWWNENPDEVEKEMMMSGGGFNVSEAYTINGLPGPSFPCSAKDTFIRTVDYGKTYLVRVINAALNAELFFSVSNHLLTVVEVDAVYTKPFKTKSIMVSPGQTTTVLLTANQNPDSSGIFLMAARPYVTSVFPYDNATTFGFLRYKNRGTGKFNPNPKNLQIHNLPLMEDHKFYNQFDIKLKSLANSQYPCRVPKSIDKRIITTIGLQLQDCPPHRTCEGFNGKRYFASMNNQSFVRPFTSLLETHFRKKSNGGFVSSFPENPPNVFDFTGVNPVTENMNTEFGTKLIVVEYGTSIEIVLQDTSFLNPENHPVHVHGHNFFIVGRGIGNFDLTKDVEKYNLVDPPERNTVAVPMGGWAAIRIKADNPGVWFIHCHLEQHTSWGLATGFVVNDGKLPSQSLLPPPQDAPSC